MSVWLILSLCWGADPGPGQIWPGFRGDGSSRTAAKRLPLDWSVNENVAWRSRLPGYGQSSPVVWGGRVFLTAVEGEKKETCIVLAVDAGTGTIEWQHRFSSTQPGPNNPGMSRAAPTPVVDRAAVFAFFESGDVASLDHAGQVRWQRSLSKEFGPFKNHHGLGSSLAQTESAVVVLVEHSGPSFLMAMNKETGGTLWKIDRNSGLAWASPIVTRFEDQEIVIVSSNGSVAAYDADSGRELWNYGNVVGNLIPSPVVAGDLLIVGAGESGLTFDHAAAAQSNCALRLISTEGKPGVEPLWKGRKAVLQYASPIEHRGLVYLVTKAGVVYCVDALTGDERFVARLDSPCWATPVTAGDHIYFFGRTGVTTVLAAGPKYQHVRTNRLWSEDELNRRRTASRDAPENLFPALPEQGRAEMETMLNDAVGDVVYGVAAVDGRFFIRTGTELLCIGDAR